MGEVADHYIPYETTAEAVVAADESFEVFVRSLFPDVELEQIAMLRAHAQSMVLEGINLGLGMSTEDPIYALQVHAQAFQQGYDQATQDMLRIKE